MNVKGFMMYTLKNLKSYTLLMSRKNFIDIRLMLENFGPKFVIAKLKLDYPILFIRIAAIERVIKKISVLYNVLTYVQK